MQAIMSLYSYKSRDVVHAAPLDAFVGSHEEVVGLDELGWGQGYGYQGSQHGRSGGWAAAAFRLVLGPPMVRFRKLLGLVIAV